MTLYSPGGLNLADTTAPLILAYDDSGTTDVVFAVSATGDLTITPDGGDISLVGTVAASLFDGPIGTGAATPAAGSFTTTSFSGNLTLADNVVIGPGTSDAADDKSVFVSGGGAASSARGAYIKFVGNEDADTGKLVLVAGNVAGGVITMDVGGAQRLSITDTEATFADSVVASDFIGAIGATTPATGAFTTLAASSTSAFTGNVGIGQAAGTNALEVTGSSVAAIGDGANVSWRRTGGSTIIGLLGNSNDLGGGGTVTDAVVRSTASMYLLTGGANLNLLLSGGATPVAAFSGDVSIADDLAVSGATDASSATAASLKTAGGIAAVKALWIGTTSRLVGNVTIDAGLLAAGDDQGALGASGAAFSDLFLASGAVINFAAGDVTLTHSAAKLLWGGDGAVEIDFNNHEMTNVDIDSGTIDATAIGGGTPAAGAFTTGAFSGSLTPSAEFLVAGVSSPPQIAGDMDDYPTAGFSHLRLDADGAHDITGFDGGSEGKLLLITNVGAQTITFTNEDAASAAANRIITGHAAPLNITTAETMIFVYDGTSSRWRVYGHHA